MKLNFLRVYFDLYKEDLHLKRLSKADVPFLIIILRMKQNSAVLK